MSSTDSRHLEELYNIYKGMSHVSWLFKQTIEITFYRLDIHVVSNANDSILYPEMPIALLLSIHLLLGVVRIYSRKVNYLFDDCSKTLLKVKQAFCSTAVDLPPEESTTPYHSITLPEAFDLDDFELPDNENLQGNFVDHHISSKDQITLQDTMEGVVYSASKCNTPIFERLQLMRMMIVMWIFSVRRLKRKRRLLNIVQLQ